MSGSSTLRRRFPWGRALAGAVAVVLLAPNSSVLEHRAVILVFLLALAAGRGRQFLRDWLPLVATAAGFIALRQVAAASPLPRQGAAVAHLEAALFGGVVPTSWLQARLFVPGHPGGLDYAATAVHASYFFGFVAVGLGTWLWRRTEFRAYTALLALTFAQGLAGYVLAPTEPPWLAAREGLGPPAHRIIAETSRETKLTATVVDLSRTWQDDPQALGDPNPVAAMPSVHTAITVALAIFLARLHPGLGALGALYALSMGLALVYLGEHFVLDLVAGLACAAVAASLSLRRRPAVPSSRVPRSPRIARCVLRVACWDWVWWSAT